MQGLPLSGARNLGPVTAVELRAAGIESLAQLRELGWEEACARWAALFPARLNLNAFCAVIGALEECDWRAVPPERKESARRLIRRLAPCAR